MLISEAARAIITEFPAERMIFTTIKSLSTANGEKLLSHPEQYPFSSPQLFLFTNARLYLCVTHSSINIIL